MSQESSTGDLEFSIGYVLKRTAATLRTAMETVLAPMGLTVAQYACLELLGQRPGQTNSELARGAFVSRQSMNHVLRGLQDRGLVTRPSAAIHGRSLPTQLNAAGCNALDAAHLAVHKVEHAMLENLSPSGHERLRQDLINCAEALKVSAHP